jgi:hypothetical protein
MSRQLFYRMRTCSNRIVPGALAMNWVGPSCPPSAVALLRRTGCSARRRNSAALAGSESPCVISESWRLSVNRSAGLRPGMLTLAKDHCRAGGRRSNPRVHGPNACEKIEWGLSMNLPAERVKDCGGKAERRHRFRAEDGFRRRRGAALPAAVQDAFATPRFKVPKVHFEMCGGFS